MGWEQTASGYAAVWATENTREALFDAMKRRETYATTGPRMIVRFFGGWDFEPNDANTRMPARVGYTKGVPMGGDLSAAPQASRRRSSLPHSRIRLAQTSIASKSSKAGSSKDGKTQEKDLRRGGIRRIARSTPMAAARFRGWEHRGRAERDLH